MHVCGTRGLRRLAAVVCLFACGLGTAYGAAAKTKPKPRPAATRTTTKATTAAAVGSTTADPGRAPGGFVTLDGLPVERMPPIASRGGCVFTVQFWNFDRGAFDVVVTFQVYPPAGGTFLYSDTVTVGEDQAGGSGDLDGQRTYDLAGIMAAARAKAPPATTFDVKLTVAAAYGARTARTQRAFTLVGCVVP